MTASPPPVLPDERLASGIARLAEHARVRTHLIVLAEHLATERLDALAHIEGAPGSGLPRGRVRGG